MGAGGAGLSSSEPTGLMVSKILACFTRAKLLKISAFVLNAVWAATALLEIGIAPVVRRCSGKMNLSRPPSRRSRATSAYCTRNTLANTMLTSRGVTPSPKTDPKGTRFSGRIISSSVAASSGLWVIEYSRNSISKPYQVSHFERQMTAVLTSYNPFGFSKVASDHVLSRQPTSPETCTVSDNFCQATCTSGDRQALSTLVVLTSFLSAPKVITLLSYECSATTQCQAGQCPRVSGSLCQQRADRKSVV